MKCFLGVINQFNLVLCHLTKTEKIFYFLFIFFFWEIPSENPKPLIEQKTSNKYDKYLFDQQKTNIKLGKNATLYAK